MSLITILNSDCQLVRTKLMQTSLFWFEVGVIFLYNEFKLELKTDYEKKSNLVKRNVQNLKNNVKDILWF